MFKNRKLTLGIIFLVLFYCFLPFTKTQAAAVNVGIVHSIERDMPTIDGVIDPIEWQNAIPRNVTLYLFGSQSNQLEITVLSIFDDNSTLYFGAIIPDSGHTASVFLIIFKINVSEPFFHFDEGFSFGSGHDVKYFETNTNTTTDYYSTTNALENPDISAGGTNDGIGKSTYNLTHTIIEMAIPFDSGDRNGCDPELDYGGSIDIWLYVGSTGEYTQLRDTDEDYDFCELKIEKLPAPVLEEISPLLDTDGNISLNWNNVPEASSYNVYRDTSTISDISGLIPIATPVDSYYSDIGLSNGTTYYYAITAENSYGVSELSNIEQVSINITTTIDISTTSETSVYIIITLINLFGVCLGVFVIKKQKKLN